jgi:hypothetical protein
VGSYNIYRIQAAKAKLLGSDKTRIFYRRFKTVKEGQREDYRRLAVIVAARLVPLTIDNIYIKLPLLRKGFLLKEVSVFPQRFRRILSTASNVSLFVIRTSFYIIRVALIIRRARFEPLLMEYVEVGSSFRGILKREWIVIPPGSRSTAIPEDATQIIIYNRARKYK